VQALVRLCHNGALTSHRCQAARGHSRLPPRSTPPGRAAQHLHSCLPAGRTTPEPRSRPQPVPALFGRLAADNSSDHAGMLEFGEVVSHETIRKALGLCGSPRSDRGQRGACHCRGRPQRAGACAHAGLGRRLDRPILAVQA
jgi:hypothetical protein